MLATFTGFYLKKGRSKVGFNVKKAEGSLHY